MLSRSRWRDISRRPKWLIRTNLDPCAVIAHCIFHPAFNRMLIAVFFHINEIDNNKTRQITKPKLAP
jgi:hypothetical protein